MIIKVCGMRDMANIREVEALGVDWVGFVFYARSSRYVGGAKSCGEARRAKRVGVFVDETPRDVISRVADFSLDVVQLHGNESVMMVNDLRRALDADFGGRIRIMKAISVGDRADMSGYCDYEGSVDYFLFDTKTPLVGGSGRKFDWNILHDYDGGTPFLVSGGIGPDDVERVRKFTHPMFAGVDLNSRFEVLPGVKDVEKLREFVKSLRRQSGV